MHFVQLGLICGPDFTLLDLIGFGILVQHALLLEAIEETCDMSRGAPP